jgi:putative acetyltransferase
LSLVELQIRKEVSYDFPQVFQVISSAFGIEDEARLVEKLRNAPTYIALVAEIDGKVVGQITFSAVSLDDEQTKFLGLAPLAVLPEFQNQGIGSRLVKEGLKVCKDNGYTAVFVLGHSRYYPRFGFEIAKQRGFSCEYPSPDESFMVLELVDGALNGKSGLIKYGPEFNEN